MIDYKKLIDDTRDIFYNSTDRHAEKPMEPVSWAAHSALKLQFENQDLLLSEGKIYYGAIVQANNLLFKRNVGGNQMPAMLIYGTDPYFDDNPIELSVMGRRVFSYKYEEDVPINICAFVSDLKNETKYSFNVPVPAEIVGDRKLFSGTVMVFRQHLPKGRFCGSFFPILAKPETCKVQMILPAKYWSKELKKIFIKNL